MQVTTKNPPTKERKKRSRATDEEGKAEDSTDDATSTTCSSDEEPLGTISTLLTAAARIEKTKAASLKASNKKTKKVAVAEKTEESSTPVGLSTLLEVASTIGVKGQNGDGGASLPAPGSKVENEPPLGNGEAREGDELFYPSAEELEEASTRRSRSALFSWYVCCCFCLFLLVSDIEYDCAR